jgi:Flp pilus assembly protein TadD
VGLTGAAFADAMDDLRAGNGSFRDGKYDDAVQAYTRAILSGQLGAEALAVTFNNRGVAYGELGDFDRAIGDYTQALGLKPDDPTSIRNLRVGYVKRGVAEANLSDFDKALADYGKAIELDPSHPLAYLRRGQLLEDRGQPDKAVPDLEKAAALEPANQQAKDLLAKARADLAVQNGTAPTATAAAEPPAAETAPPAAMAESSEPGKTLTVTASPQATPPPTTAPTPSPPATPAAAEKPAPVEKPAAPPVVKQPQTAAANGGGPLATLPDGVDRVRLKQAVNLRSGPGNEFDRMTTLPGGTELPVVSVNKGWYELQLKDGKRGFIYQKWLVPASQ